jgi:hypothetical protein
MAEKKTTKTEAADIKATVKDILNAGKVEETAKAPAKKAPAKKAPAKKAAPAKTATKSTATKTAAKKTASKDAPKAIVQLWGQEFDVADVIAKAEKAYSKKKNVKEVYIKPEEGKAYYVADDDSGSVDLW